MSVKYDRIGVNYNSTRKPDPYIADRIFDFLNCKPDGLYLDIGCGTGNYTDVLQRRGLDFIGIDPSLEMLNRAKQRNKAIDFRIGSVEAIDLVDCSLDGVVGSLTIHHWEDLDKGFLELSRVLKPNGTVVIFTSIPKQMKCCWLAHYFPKMIAASILQMPTFYLLSSAMKNAGLEIVKTEKYDVQIDLKDQFLYCGKHDPTLYLDPQIRSGISSFSDLANQKEIDEGLKRLEMDIRTEKVSAVMASYRNEIGDYLFVVGKK